MTFLSVLTPFRTGSLIFPRLFGLSLSWMPGSIHTHRQFPGLKYFTVLQSFHRQIVETQEHLAIAEETVSQALMLVNPRC